MTIRTLLPFAFMVLAGCDHSAVGNYSVTETNPPLDVSSAARLTYNIDQDDWPVWTADGKGILYTFVDQDAPRHRCVGLLPAAGGTRLWEFCDHREIEDDSLISYTGYAMSSAGLLIMEVRSALQNSTPIVGPHAAQATLWLTDTSGLGDTIQKPREVAIAEFPQTVSAGIMTSLEDIQWTGANQFVALGMRGDAVPRCLGPHAACPTIDTIFTGVAVVQGAVAGGRATFASIAGTEGAQEYALIPGGAGIAFTLRTDTHLYRVPITGGPPVTVATVAPLRVSTTPGLPPDTTTQLLGVTCSSTRCLVARADLHIFAANPLPTGPVLGSSVPLPDLRLVDLATGAVTILPTTGIYQYLPKRSPISGDVVIQRGGPMAHFGSWSGPPDGDIYLFRGLMP